MNLRAKVGGAVLVVLLVGSATSALWTRVGGVPDCVFGLDPLFPYETVCSQTLGGLWRSLALGLLGGAGACALALVLALVSRAGGGVVDAFVEKGAELFFSIPDVLVLISLAFVARAVQGGESVSLPWMAASLVAIGWAAPTRMVQNRLRSLDRLDFVTAARALGATEWRVLTRHLLPFAWDYVFAIFLLRVPAIILTESTISYLGFGLPLSEPSLGKYIGDHWRLLTGEDWLDVAPAWLLLVLVVVSFHWVGNGLLERAKKVSP